MPIFEPNCVQVNVHRLAATVYQWKKAIPKKILVLLTSKLLISIILKNIDQRNMNLNPIEKAYHTVSSGINEAYDVVGKFLDKNPTLYKIVLMASHFFRAVAMFGAMMWLPIPMLVTTGVMVTGTLLYRAAVERFCCFRFAIPSMVGAGAAWFAHLTAVNFVSGVALSSIAMTIAHSLLFLPLLGYTAWVIYLSHSDIEKRMELLFPSKKEVELPTEPDCCCKV